MNVKSNLDHLQPRVHSILNQPSGLHLPSINGSSLDIHNRRSSFRAPLKTVKRDYLLSPQPTAKDPTLNSFSAMLVRLVRAPPKDKSEPIIQPKKEGVPH